VITSTDVVDHHAKVAQRAGQDLQVFFRLFDHPDRELAGDHALHFAARQVAVQVQPGRHVLPGNPGSGRVPDDHLTERRELITRVSRPTISYVK
jgi:hypothetical protein